MLFFELANHFLHFNKLLGKTMPKLLVTYGNAPKSHGPIMHWPTIE